MLVNSFAFSAERSPCLVGDLSLVEDPRLPWEA